MAAVACGSIPRLALQQPCRARTARSGDCDESAPRSKNERSTPTCEAMKNVIAAVALRGKSVARVLVDFIQSRLMPAVVDC
jgi:hypothetical protein